MKSMKYIVLFICVALLAFAGCKKSEPEQAPADTAQKAVEQQDNLAAKDTKADNPETQKPAANSDDSAKPDSPAAEENSNDNAFPELRTHQVEISTHPWGKIERTTVDWHADIQVFYEIPVFNETSDAYKEINAYFSGLRENFLSKGNLESAWGYERSRHEFNGPDVSDEEYVFTYKISSVAITKETVSVVTNLDWYMGGVGDGGPVGFVFDVATGKSLQLEDIYHKSEAQVHDIVEKAVKKFVDSREDYNPGLIEWDSLKKYKGFRFYIENGIPHVVFKKYEIAVGAAGALDIPLPMP